MLLSGAVDIREVEAYLSVVMEKGGYESTIGKSGSGNQKAKRSEYVK